MSDPMPRIIAEAGVNHNGELARAKEMVAAAAEAGADFVKFQAFNAAELVTAEGASAAYQSRNAGVSRQRDLLAELELNIDEIRALAAEAEARGVGFLCTPFDVAMTPALIDMGMRCIKIGSGELTNAPALRQFAGFGLPIFLSTGMATLAEVEAAIAVLRGEGARDITLLHCTSLYPAPAETANLRAMTTMADRFGLPVGYSDHTLGDHVAVAAVALGACVIEKHFTLDRSLPGPDHAASVEPGELAALVRRLRETARALGDGIKQPAPGEAEIAKLVRRSWHASRDLAAGAVLAEADLALKRPADGLPPDQPPVGRRLVAARKRDAPIRPDDLTGGGRQ